MGYPFVWVGGLKGIVLERDLVEKFSQYGKILHVKIPYDSDTSKSCHYGFVVYGDESTAEYAASQAHKTKIFGGKIVARGPAEQRENGYSGEYTGKIGHVPTMNNDSRATTECKYHANGTCTNGTYCPYQHSKNGSSAGMKFAAVVRECALMGCSKPCHVDDNGTVHECCSYIHGMEHSRRAEEEMEQKMVIKGVSHCFLPGCNSVTWPFMNYCGVEHEEMGKKRRLFPPKLPESQHATNSVTLRVNESDREILKSMKDVMDFLRRSTQEKFEVEIITENEYAKPGGLLYKKFVSARNKLPKQHQVTCLAFHGTLEKNIESICKNGYDSNKRNKQRHGLGEYFACTPDIPLRYCKGGKKILLNELLLGKEGVHHITKPKLGIIVMKHPEHDLPRFVITIK